MAEIYQLSEPIPLSQFKIKFHPYLNLWYVTVPEAENKFYIKTVKGRVFGFAPRRFLSRVLRELEKSGVETVAPIDVHFGKIPELEAPILTRVSQTEPKLYKPLEEEIKEDVDSFFKDLYLFLKGQTGDTDEELYRDFETRRITELVSEYLSNLEKRRYLFDPMSFNLFQKAFKERLSERVRKERIKERIEEQRKKGIIITEKNFDTQLKKVLEETKNGIISDWNYTKPLPKSSKDETFRDTIVAFGYTEGRGLLNAYQVLNSLLFDSDEIQSKFFDQYFNEIYSLLQQVYEKLEKGQFEEVDDTFRVIVDGEDYWIPKSRAVSEQRKSPKTTVSSLRPKVKKRKGWSGDPLHPSWEFVWPSWRDSQRVMSIYSSLETEEVSLSEILEGFTEKELEKYLKDGHLLVAEWDAVIKTLTELLEERKQLLEQYAAISEEINELKMSLEEVSSEELVKVSQELPEKSYVNKLKQTILNKEKETNEIVSKITQNTKKLQNTREQIDILANKTYAWIVRLDLLLSRLPEWHNVKALLEDGAKQGWWRFTGSIPSTPPGSAERPSKPSTFTSLAEKFVEELDKVNEEIVKKLVGGESVLLQWDVELGQVDGAYDISGNWNLTSILSGLLETAPINKQKVCQKTNIDQVEKCESGGTSSATFVHAVKAGLVFTHYLRNRVLNRNIGVEVRLVSGNVARSFLERSETLKPKYEGSVKPFSFDIGARGGAADVLKIFHDYVFKFEEVLEKLKEGLEKIHEMLRR